MEETAGELLERVKPFVWFYSPEHHGDPDDPDDVAEWVAQSGAGDRQCGGSFPTLAEALVCARLLAIRERAGWSADSWVIGSVAQSKCWCGWSKMLSGCHADDITAHVIEAHPDHWAVKG